MYVCGPQVGDGGIHHKSNIVSMHGMKPLFVHILQFKTRLTKEGEFVVVSQVYRTQHKNLEDAVQRLTAMLEEVSEIPRGPSGLTMARVRTL